MESKARDCLRHSAAHLTDSTLQLGKVKASSDTGTAPPGGSEVERAQEEKKRAPPATEADTRRLVHELQVHQIELEMQNEELVQSRAEVEALLRQYTDLYDFAPVGYFTLARDGAIHQVNLAGANLLGVERGALIKRRFGVFVSAESRPTFKPSLKKYSEASRKRPAKSHSRKMGPLRFGCTSKPCSEDGQECRAVVVDITERKRAEEILRKVNRALRMLSECNKIVVRATDEYVLVEKICHAITDMENINLHGLPSRIKKMKHPSNLWQWLVWIKLIFKTQLQCGSIRNRGVY